RANNIDEIHENNNKGFNVLGAAPVTGINDDYNIIPDKYLLYQSFPNPFNPSATIRYSVPVGDIVKIKVYDILGKEISTLVNEYQTPGTYNVEFNCGNFSSGIYFYRMQSGNFVDVKKMILIK
ncbi:MAG: T9SS type A sorting domain-containing protein, partial [Syntrophothermus sp.]